MSETNSIADIKPEILDDDRPEKQRQPGSEALPNISWRRRCWELAKSVWSETKDILGLVAKYAAPAVAAYAVYMANNISGDYQSRITSVQLLSQREAAESQIRSAMFRSLVTPLTQSSQSDQLDPERYFVLVNLLALNFHDQFEVKPLLLDADRVLANSKTSQGSQGAFQDSSADAEHETAETGNTQQIELKRQELRETARRIIDREILSLQSMATSAKQNPIQVENIFFPAWGFDAPANEYGIRVLDDEALQAHCVVGHPGAASSVRSECAWHPDGSGNYCLKAGASKHNYGTAPNTGVCVQSDDKKYQLIISLLDFEPEQTATTVNVEIWRRKDEPGSEQMMNSDDCSAKTKYCSFRAFEFRLTQFDFPLTDNSRLDPEHRFALSLYEMEEDAPIVLKLSWFPKNFIGTRERPMNFITLRESLGLDESKAQNGWMDSLFGTD